MNTLDYYNQHADEFSDNTLSADVSQLYSHFESRLPKGASVIDLGCGSGRDSRHFLEAGYSVTAIDGSEELCKLAHQLLGIQKDIGTLTGCAPELKCLEYWLSADARIDHASEKWLISSGEQKRIALRWR